MDIPDDDLKVILAALKGAPRPNLRSLIERIEEHLNPKPDEPKAIGAVVSDQGGRLYVRISTSIGAGPWRCEQRAGSHSWSDIDVAEVLHPGWIVGF